MFLEVTLPIIQTLLSVALCGCQGGKENGCIVNEGVDILIADSITIKGIGSKVTPPFQYVCRLRTWAFGPLVYEMEGAVQEHFVLLQGFNFELYTTILGILGISYQIITMLRIIQVDIPLCHGTHLLDDTVIITKHVVNHV